MFGVHVGELDVNQQGDLKKTTAHKSRDWNQWNMEGTVDLMMQTRVNLLSASTFVRMNCSGDDVLRPFSQFRKGVQLREKRDTHGSLKAHTETADVRVCTWLVH